MLITQNIAEDPPVPHRESHGSRRCARRPAPPSLCRSRAPVLSRRCFARARDLPGKSGRRDAATSPLRWVLRHFARQLSPYPRLPPLLPPPPPPAAQPQPLF